MRKSRGLKTFLLLRILHMLDGRRLVLFNSSFHRTAFGVR